MRKLYNVNVSDRIYFIHLIAKWKEIKSISECNSFAKSYRMPRGEFNNFYELVNGNSFKKEGRYKFERIITKCLKSIDATIWVCKYINLVSSIICVENLNSSYFDLMFNKEINYPNYESSEEYRSIKTLLSFYKSLIYNWHSEEFCCNYTINIKTINDNLNNITEADIEEDLNNHGIISKISSYEYEWINLTVLYWLEETSSIRLYELNQYKLLKDL